MKRLRVKSKSYLNPLTSEILDDWKYPAEISKREFEKTDARDWCFKYQFSSTYHDDPMAVDVFLNRLSR